MIFTSSASGSDELLRPSLAATRVQQGSVFLRPPARRATRHLFRRTPSEHRKTAAQPHAVET